MRRVAVIGSAGAGKSTLSRELGALLGLPVIHLDRLFWRPGWVETPREEWVRVQAEAVRGERWVIDGNYGGTLERRLGAADTIIFLDFPRLVCVWRVLRRRLQYARRQRPDMTPGCRETLDWAFLRWVWRFPADDRPRILDKLAALPPDKQVIRLASPAAVSRFKGDLRREGPGAAGAETPASPPRAG
jgi:adenylate kinase family enzyme